VYPGVPAEYLAGSIANRKSQTAHFSVGYLARICPEKGFERLVDGMMLLIKKPGLENTRLIAAGYLGKKDHAFYADMKKRIAASPLAKNYDFRGEVNAADKLKLMDDADVFSTPSIYAEPKGLPVIESLARGTPVVQPHHGTYPELVEITGGGVTVPPGDAPALADALADLLRDPAKRKWLGDAGHAAVKARFLDTHMAEGMLAIFRGTLSN
jgi:glycosyltransferase involved in cell wall biosynthesis